MQVFLATTCLILSRSCDKLSLQVCLIVFLCISGLFVIGEKLFVTLFCSKNVSFVLHIKNENFMNTHYSSSGQILMSPESYLTVPAKTGVDVEIWVYSQTGRLISHVMGKSLSEKYVCLCKNKSRTDVASIAVVNIEDVSYVYKIKRAWVIQALFRWKGSSTDKKCIKGRAKRGFFPKKLLLCNWFRLLTIKR